MVIHGEVFTGALVAQMTSERMRQIAATTIIGSIKQFSTNTDFLEDSRFYALLRQLYTHI